MNPKNNSTGNLFIREAQVAIDQFEAQWKSPGITVLVQDPLDRMDDLMIPGFAPEIHRALCSAHEAMKKTAIDFTELTPEEWFAKGYIEQFMLFDDHDYPLYGEWMFGIADKKIILATDDKLRASSERIWHISKNLQYLQRVQDIVNDPLKNAIQQMIRLYSLGQDASCIMMSRTAIELALKIKTNPFLEKFQNVKDRYYLKDRLQLVRKHKMIPEKAISMAYDVNLLAIKITHDDPGLSENVDKVMAMTVGVITGILTGKCENSDIAHEELMKELGFGNDK